MSVILPPVIAIKSAVSKAYLMVDSVSQTDGILTFTGKNVFSPASKFEVFTAEIGKGLVHIRCSQNKKFLRKVNPSDDFIDPAADKQEEDRSKWSCTLFEPRPVDGKPDQVQLVHVQTQMCAVLPFTDSTRFSLAYPKEHEANQDMNIIDLESLVILPKHVAFKGRNEKYLGVVRGDGYMAFNCTAKGHPETWFEISTDGHGRAQIMSNHYKMAWKARGDWIFSQASANDLTDDNTNFWPVKVNHNSIALSSFDNKFCAQVWDGERDSIKAEFSSITPESSLVVEELVLSRRIYNSNFDLANARIYGETPVTVAIANASNLTDAENTVEFKFTHAESKSSTWRTSHSWMAGISVEAEFSIPFVTGGKVKATAQYSGSYEWGETITTENKLETTYNAVVPPNSSIKVKLLATKGSCDVPYSYYQKDVLYNGKTVMYKKDDGLYTGVNSYNFRCKVKTKSHPATSQMDPTQGQTIEF